MNRFEGDGISREQIPMRKLNIALEFQDKIRDLGEKTLTSEPQKDINLASLLLATNEYFDTKLKVAIQNSESPPNGYIIGVGFGNILHMIEICQRDIIPIALIGTDIRAHMVLGARAAISELSRDGCDVYTFLENIRENPNASVDAVIDSESNNIIRNRFISAREDAIINLSTTPPIKAQGKRSQKLGKSIIDVIADNFSILHQLSAEGNMGITLADITNQYWISEISKLPNFANSRNIIYLSNIMDHISNYGENTNMLNSFEPFSALGENKNRGNIFIDTLQSEPLHYTLRAGNTIPRFTEDDFH